MKTYLLPQNDSNHVKGLLNKMLKKQRPTNDDYCQTQKHSTGKFR